MIKVTYHSSFHKSYRKQSKFIQDKFKERLLIFMRSPSHPLLRDHGLKGSLKSQRAFCITGDVRVIYVYLAEDIVELLKIGTHNQVY